MKSYAALVSFMSPLIIYTIISLVFFGIPTDINREIFDGYPDSVALVWFLNWWPFAIEHLLNPFVTHYIWAPGGSNMTWLTSVPSAALFGVPITLLFGPVATYNILTLLAPALSGWTAFLLARYLTGNWVAALFGGYLFGFSSYELGQMQGHLNLILVLMVPIIVLLCVSRARNHIGRLKFICLLAISLIVQLGFSTEILATLCIFGAIGWVVFWICSPDRHGLHILAIDIAICSVPTLLLASPFLFYIVQGAKDIAPHEIVPASYSADLLNYIIPTQITRLGRSVFYPVSVNFPGNTSEQGSYLGLPLLCILAVYFQANLKSTFIKATFAVLALLITFSFGPFLHIAGILTALPLPWDLMQHLPLLGMVLPSRISMFVALISAVITALYLAENTPRRTKRIGIAMLACLFLIPNYTSYRWINWPHQAFYTKQNITQILGLNKKVLIVPTGAVGEEMAWQVNSGMLFTQASGYVGYPPYREWRFSVINEITSSVPSHNFREEITEYCQSHGVNYILVDSATPRTMMEAVASLGWITKTNNGVLVVRVPTVPVTAHSGGQ